MADCLDLCRPEAVVNFAAQSEVAPSWENPDHWFQTNCTAFSRLIDHLRRRDYLKRYLHISTPEVYGSCRGPVTEEHALNPSTPYAVSRAAQDMFLKICHQQFGFPVVSVRSANVYGAHQQLWKIIPRWVIYLKEGRKVPLHGGGLARRSFIHIRDVSRGEFAALTFGQSGEVYHLSTPEIHPIREVVRRICEVMEKWFDRAVENVGERPGQDSAYVLDTTKARNKLQWAPEVSLESGIREAVGWIESHWDQIHKESHDYVHAP